MPLWHYTTPLIWIKDCTFQWNIYMGPFLRKVLIRLGFDSLESLSLSYFELLQCFWAWYLGLLSPRQLSPSFFPGGTTLKPNTTTTLHREKTPPQKWVSSECCTGQIPFRTEYVCVWAELCDCVDMRKDCKPYTVYYCMRTHSISEFKAMNVNAIPIKRVSGGALNSGFWFRK